MPLADGYIALKQKTNQLAGNLDRWMKEHKKESFSLPYAYPCDNYINSILSNEWVYAALQKFAKILYVLGVCHITSFWCERMSE